MEMPGKPPKIPDPGVTELPWSQIHIGELPGVATSPGGGSTKPVIATVCAPDRMLDLPAWGAAQEPMDLLSSARSGFYGEFDEIEPKSAIQAVQRYLYLGFGAEARQVVRHGHVTVNGRRVDIPSCQVRAGDVIAVAEGAKEHAPRAQC